MIRETLWNSAEKLWSKTRNYGIIIATNILLAIAWGCQFSETQSKDASNKIEAIDSAKIQELADTYEKKAYEAGKKQEQTVAIPNYLKALEYYQQLDNRKKEQIISKNIALGYYQQGNFPKYLEYIQKALELAKEIDYEYGIRFANASIWEYRYSIKDQPEVALQKYYLPGRDSLKTLINEEDKKELQTMYANAIGNCYMQMKSYDEAKKYRKQALEGNKESGDQGINININYNMWIIEEREKDYTQAKAYFLEGLKGSQKKGTRYNIKDWYMYLADINEAMGNYEEAYTYRTQQYNTNQEINNEISSKTQIELETSIKDKQLIEQKAEIAQQQEKEKTLEEQKKTMTRTIIAALTAALGAWWAAVASIKAKRKERKHKLEIERKNFHLEEKNAEVETVNIKLEETNTQLEAANRELAYKNKSITDSIHYAKRIQERFLQHPEELKKLFPESFMFYQPKDIVNGDFYRFKETPSGKKIIAAVDCTGHGVPGAFLTIIGNNILNDSIEAGKEKPWEILDFLSDGIKKQLKEKEQFQGDAIKDAMDIAIFSYDPKTEEFESAGAYNTIYIFKKGNMQKIKWDKLALWQYEDAPYTNQKLFIERWSTVYLGTDGYADQFGGPKNRKFMTRKLTKLLEELQKPKLLEWEEELRLLTIQEQEQIIRKEFNNRKGDNEQTDDVLIIGIKV